VHYSVNPGDSPEQPFVEAMLAGDVPAVDIRNAYARTMLRARNRRAFAARTGALAAAACIVLALALTPAGGYANAFLTIFQPKTFTSIGISRLDSEQLRLAPKLTDFGSFRGGHPQRANVATLAAAARVAGFRARTIPASAALPAGGPHYAVLRGWTVSFTFSAAKAAAYERRFHRRLAPMPAGLDGTTIRAAMGPGIVTIYGSDWTHGGGRRARPAPDTTAAFVQMKPPHVTSTGASLDVLAGYLLSLPNVPADVAAQLRRISDPSSTLPIPIPIDRAAASSIRIDGTNGLAIGDDTGLGAVVLWQKDGVLYAIGGPLEERTAIALGDAVR
jgi:hypothetical protein